MKTINILPSINNIALSGRILNMNVNEAKTRCQFSLIHNFGGDKEPSVLTFVMFNKEGKFPDCIKKGNAVIVNAMMRNNVYENEGKKTFRTDYIVKNVEEVKSANDIQFAGRLIADPEISGRRCSFRVIRNFGGDTEPLALQFIMFNKDSKFPEVLKKGTPVTVKAYVSSNNYTGEDGEKYYRNEFIVKSVEKAELVEKQVEDKVTVEEAEASEE